MLRGIERVAVTSGQRLLDGGQYFGEQDPTPAVLASSAACLRNLLRKSGFTGEAARIRVGPATGAAGGPPAADEYFERRHDDAVAAALAADQLGLLLQLFLVGRAVPRAEIADALVKELLATGLLVPHAANASLVLAPVQVYPVDLDDGTTLLVATDWPIESVHLASASRVMPIGVDSLTLALGMPAGLCSNKRVLDVCCGSGIQALAAAAAGASHVTASDISPRAVRFTQFNAALNAQPSVIALCGDGLDAVRGQRFDVILANPPFVAVPPGVSDDAAWYVTGGADGANLVRRLMQDADGALARGGCLLVVTQLPNPDEAHSWLASGSALEVAFVYDPRHTQSAAVYAAEHAADSGAASSDAWRAGLEAAGVASIGFGVFAARRVADGGGGGGGGSIRVASGSARHGMLDGGVATRSAMPWAPS